MYATCASETSSCRLFLLRGGAEAEADAEADAEAVVGAEAERVNKERRRKMRVTELNIVRIDRFRIEFGGVVQGWGLEFLFLFDVGCCWDFVEGTITRVEVFM